MSAKRTVQLEESVQQKHEHSEEDHANMDQLEEEGQPSFAGFSNPMVGSKKLRKSISNKQKKVIVDHLYDHGDVKSSAMERAEEVQAYLAADIPSFVKYMLPSHVMRGFWLGLPRDFCKFYMPGHDSIVTLVDERGKEFETNYLVSRNGLSGGWRRFSIAHGLCERDVLVFQLVLPFKLKVYIVREIGLTEVDGALGLMKLAHARGTNCETAAEKLLKPVPIEKKSRKVSNDKDARMRLKRSSLRLTVGKAQAIGKKADFHELFMITIK